MALQAMDTNETISIQIFFNTSRRYCKQRVVFRTFATESQRAVSGSKRARPRAKPRRVVCHELRVPVHWCFSRHAVHYGNGVDHLL